MYKQYGTTLCRFPWRVRMARGMQPCLQLINLVYTIAAGWFCGQRGVGLPAKVESRVRCMHLMTGSRGLVCCRVCMMRRAEPVLGVKNAVSNGHALLVSSIDRRERLLSSSD
jgi:hypothetical protein